MNDRWIDAEALARFAAEGTTLHRIYSEPGTWIERCGDDLLLCVRRTDEVPVLQRETAEWAAAIGFAPTRLFVKALQQQPGGEKYVLLAGDATLPLDSVATEGGLRYRIDFAAGYSNGFFIDQRENRRFLRGLPPGRLLNCFAYTSSFSVAAAAAGWETTSIDLSKRALDWARANFRLNGLAPEAPHRFWPDDVRDVLRRQGNRGEKFNAVILDPPTFSRTKQGKVFRVEDEMPLLAKQAFPLVEPGGHLLLSTNCERLAPDDLLAFADSAARESGRTFARVEVPLPSDVPADQGAQSVWLRVD